MENYLTLQREMLATRNVFINTDLGEEKLFTLQIKKKCFLELTKTLMDKSLAENLFEDIGADSVDEENNSSGRIGGKIESFFNQRTL